jgi:hypothetical protein
LFVHRIEVTSMDLTRPEPRRRLFKLALAAAAGFVSSRLGEPRPASAANGDAVINGSQFNSSTTTTVLRNTTMDGTTLQADARDGSGWAVYGYAPGGTGVMGYSTNYRGVLGSTSTGHAVHAIAEGDGGTGMYATSKYGPALVAIGDGYSTGVIGIAGQGTIPEGNWGQVGVFGYSKVGLSTVATGMIGVVGSDVPAGLTDDSAEVGVFGYSDTSPNAAGVVGKSVDGVGAAGVSDNSVGVVGVGPIGVQGSGYLGVYGWGRQAVVGDATPDATGLFGWVGAEAPPEPPAGVAVHAESEAGFVALNVVGKARFSRSGRTSIAAGKKSTTVTMSGVTTSSYVIATLQTNRTGVFVRAVVPAAGKFTIYLNKAASGATDVGFLVIN